MNGRTIQLHPTARVRRGQQLQHALPALLLIWLGVEELLGGELAHPWVTWLGLIAGSVLLVLLKRNWSRPEHSHGLVDWYDVVAGVVIIIEGYHKIHQGHWFQPGTLTVGLGVAVILMGVFHRQLAARRQLAIDAGGFLLRRRPFGGLRMRWSDLQAVKLDGTTLCLRTDGSETRVSLRRIENRDQVLKELRAELATQPTE